MLRPEIVEDFPCCGSGRHAPTVAGAVDRVTHQPASIYTPPEDLAYQVHSKSAELVDCAVAMRDLGKQPAEIIAHLLEVYSEELPEPDDEEIPPEVVERILAAVRRELQRP